MANVFTKADGQGWAKWSVDTSASLDLKDAGGFGVGRWQVFVDGGGSKSITIKAYPNTNSLTASDAEEHHYLKVADGTLVAGSTAITADGNYDILSDGRNAVLVVTYTSGTVTIYVKAVQS